MTLKNISNIVRIDKHSFTGVLPNGEQLKVYRAINDWQVTLNIVVSGYLMHEDVPTASEKIQFETIINDAFERDALAKDDCRAKAASEARKHIFNA